MKRLLLIWAVAAVASACVSQKQQAPERQAWRCDTALYGDVESVTVATYTRINEDGTINESDYNHKLLYSFNENGDVKEYNVYEFNGALSERGVFEYDLNNKLLFEMRYNAEGTLCSKTSYQYDNDGNIISKSLYDYLERVDDVVSYIYDSMGRLIEENWTYGYSEHRCVEPGSNRYVYLYDSLGNMVEKTGSDSSTIYEVLRCKYDLDGRIIETEELRYDNWTEELSSTNNVYYTYDSQDNIESISDICHYGESRYEWRYLYKYDKQHNLVEKIKYKDDSSIPSEILIFEIVYRE